MIPSAVQFLETSAPLLAAGTAGLAYGTFAPRSTLWGPVISRGAPDATQRVALTFDDGPLPNATDRILDVLGELGATATFFVIGRNAEKHPRLVQRMHDEKHLVGNHSYDHAACGFLRGPWFWGRQLALTDAAVARIIGMTPRLFRPPLGIKTLFTAGAARKSHVTVTWTRRGLDGISTTSDAILGRLAPHARAGDILALHDGVGPQSRRDPSATVEAMRPLIARLRERGLNIGSLDSMTSIEPYRGKP